jgi:hypothetical protein
MLLLHPATSPEHEKALMTDLFAYHAAKEQMADLRRTAGQNRLTTTANHDRWLTNTRRVISRVLGSISNTRSIHHRTAASHPTTDLSRLARRAIQENRPDELHPGHDHPRKETRDRQRTRPAIASRAGDDVDRPSTDHEREGCPSTRLMQQP